MANLSIKTGTISRSMLVGNSPYVPPSFESIATATGNGSSGSITFSSIPQTYKHLQIRGVYNDGGYNMRLVFNSDTGANYCRHTLIATGSAVTSGGGINQNDLDLISYGASGTNNMSVCIIDIADYTSTTRYKTAKAFDGYTESASTLIIYNSSGLWQNTNAINSITITNLYGSYNTNTVYSLYGIKG
jgi:hypothetical protein